MRRWPPAGLWDVLLTGANVLNHPVWRLVPEAQAGGVGIVAMHAIRWLLTDGDRLRSDPEDLLVTGRTESGHAIAAVLDRLDSGELADVLPAAGYRLVMDRPGIASVLVGTGNRDHLESNIEAIEEVGGDARAAELIDLLDATCTRPRGSRSPPRARSTGPFSWRSAIALGYLCAWNRLRASIHNARDDNFVLVVKGGQVAKDTRPTPWSCHTIAVPLRVVSSL